MFKELIQQLLALVGPLLGQLIQKWLESLLNSSAKKVSGVDEDDSDEAKMTALLEKALSSTPRTRPGKRMLLKNIMWVVENGIPKKLSDADKDDIKDAVGSAKKDD